MKNYTYRRPLLADILGDIAKWCPGSTPKVMADRSVVEWTVTIEEKCKGDLDDYMASIGWLYVGEA